MEYTSLSVAYVLIVAGFLLLAGELFLPASGTLVVASLVCLVVGIGLVFYNDSITGAVTLAVVCVAFPLAGIGLLKLWPRTRLGKKMILDQPPPDATVAASSLNQELDRLKGSYGRATADLRPSGVVDFDGRRVDAITEGMMVQAGQWVRCIDVRAGRVLVRPMEAPELGRLESLDLPDLLPRNHKTGPADREGAGRPPQGNDS